MKISTKGRYGLTIMIDLARKVMAKDLLLLKSIAKENNLSEHYLEQLSFTVTKCRFN